MKQSSIALVVAFFATFSYVATADFLHHKQEVAISGARVSGAREMEKITKADYIKEALGLGGYARNAAAVPYGCKSAFQLVSGSPEFTILTAAIQAAGLTSILDDPSLIATVFAPNDAAFATALAALNVTPQKLLNDPATLAILLKYHIIPGVSLLKSDLTNGQVYDTLLEDTHYNKYQIQYVYNKIVDLGTLKADQNLTESTSYKYYVIPYPTGGLRAQITTFDLNKGCPTVADVINNVLIPDYKDAVLPHSVDSAVGVISAYQAVNASVASLSRVSGGSQ